MESDTVRLTVQIRDEKNQIRSTVKVDVPVKDLGDRAADIATRMGAFYQKEKRALRYGANAKETAKGAAASA